MDGTSLDRRESTDRNFGFLVNDIARLMRTGYDRRMRALGLTRSQWWVLTHVFFNEGINQTELSEVLEVERATLGRMLDRLEAKGWVERRPDASDRRVKRVFLTGEVEPLLQTMRTHAADIRAISMAGFNAVEQERFIDLLLRIKRNLAATLGERCGFEDEAAAMLSRTPGSVENA